MCIDRPCSLDEYAKTEIQIHVYWKLWNAKKIRFNFDWVFFGESKSWHSLKLGRRSLLRKSEHQKTNQNTKEHQKICKPSLHRKCLFSSSLLQQKSDFRCSDFTYGVKKDHNVENQNINYYGILPMVTKACGALGG